MSANFILGSFLLGFDADHGVARAKLVRADFTQAIEGHWRNRAIEWNRVSYPGG